VRERRERLGVRDLDLDFFFLSPPDLDRDLERDLDRDRPRELALELRRLRFSPESLGLPTSLNSLLFASLSPMLSSLLVSTVTVLLAMGLGLLDSSLAGRLPLLLLLRLRDPMVTQLESIRGQSMVSHRRSNSCSSRFIDPDSKLEQVYKSSLLKCRRCEAQV
jgi:hypothetical protein